jgi:hypothetical protein
VDPRDRAWESILDPAHRIGRPHDDAYTERHRARCGYDDRGGRNAPHVDGENGAIANELGREGARRPCHGAGLGDAEVMGYELHEGEELNLLFGSQRLSKRRVTRLELPESDEEIELLNHLCTRCCADRRVVRWTLRRVGREGPLIRSLENVHRACHPSAVYGYAQSSARISPVPLRKALRTDGWGRPLPTCRLVHGLIALPCRSVARTRLSAAGVSAATRKRMCASAARALEL